MKEKEHANILPDVFDRVKVLLSGVEVVILQSLINYGTAMRTTNELFSHPDWNREKPTEEQSAVLWSNITIEPIDSWSNGAIFLKEKINETHLNGGLQLHKFKIHGDQDLNWFLMWKVYQKDFVKDIINRPELQNYRKNLQIKDGVVEVKRSDNWYTDIYSLSGNLARTLGMGGAYNNLTPQKAWEVATQFIQEEFQNRFDEFLLYPFSIDSAQWFQRIAWDYSCMLFDWRNNQVIFIDITDTD